MVWSRFKRDIYNLSISRLRDKCGETAKIIFSTTHCDGLMESAGANPVSGMNQTVVLKNIRANSYL